jgi:hypothetical protein
MKKSLVVLFVLLVASTAFTQTMPPAIFYSNLTSGPNTGGQNNAGAFVTIHGRGFGTSQGSSVVTIGGGNASGYQSWSDTSVTFQLGALSRTGNIVVNVGGVTSNSVPFTIRSGNIYFVSTSGSDKKAGSYSAPWQTLVRATNAVKAGDIIYLEDGYELNATESVRSALFLSRGGTVSAPMAIVAYPHSSVSIGTSTGPITGIDVNTSNWVLSGLAIRGTETAVSIGSVTGVRLTDNDVSCPNGSGSAACIATNGASSFTLLGNNIHDNGSAASTNLTSYQAISLLNTNGVEIGWNAITNTLGCNAISAHSSTGAQHSYLVHDNYIQKTRCEAIALGMVNPSLGAVSLYNNIIQNSGTGPAPAGTSQGYEYAAIAVGGGSNVPVQAYNNTIYDAGEMGGASAGAVCASGAVNLTNNIVYLLGGEQYVSLDTDLSWITGSNNLFFGAGNPLGVFSDSVYGDPKFVTLATNNFHLQAGSPAIDHGATLLLAADYDGVPRPQGAAYDIGAYEYPSQGKGAGTLSISSPSLSFDAVTVGQSAAATAVLSNSSDASVTISQALSNNSNFRVSGINFPLPLKAGESTTLNVSFVPTSAGAQSGTIAVASDALNTPTNIAVNGTAQAPVATVSLSPTSLTFASQTVATTSASQAVTLTNTGTASLSISGITASGDYVQTNNCGSSLAISAKCNISVTFTPTTTGTRSGSISFTDNAASSPQQVLLSGSATPAPSATLQMGTKVLSFGSITAGTSSTQNLVITNTGNVSATISQISTGNTPFSVGAITLPATVAATGSLTLKVTFTPTAAGPYTGTLVIQSNATNATLSAGLSGTGLAPSTTAPFASSSTWKTPVANLTGALFTSLGSALSGTITNPTISPWPKAGWVSIYSAQSSDPVVQLYFNPDAWTNIANGAWLNSGNSPAVEAAIMAGSSTTWPTTWNQYSTADVTGVTQVAPSSYHSQQSNYWSATPNVPATAVPAFGADGHMTVFQPNGWALETMGTIRLSNGNIACMYASYTWPGSNGTGYQNGRRASMVPNYAGLIRNGELASGTIAHALAVSLPENAIKRQINWPAYAVDMSNSYSGAVPYGALLALPPSLNISTLGLTTPLGSAIANAAKTYGMYVVDATAPGTFIVDTEVAASDLPGWSGPEQADLTAIIKALQLVAFTPQPNEQ